MMRKNTSSGEVVVTLLSCEAGKGTVLKGDNQTEGRVLVPDRVPHVHPGSRVPDQVPGSQPVPVPKSHVFGFGPTGPYKALPIGPLGALWLVGPVGPAPWALIGQ